MRGDFVRLISMENVLNLKGAADASFRLGGGVTSFALLTRVVVSTLGMYASRGERREDGEHEHDKTMIPVDIAVEADMRAGSPIITGEMARQLGFRLEPLVGEGAVRRLTEADAHHVLAATMDVSRAILEAKSDGRVDFREWEIIEQEAREAIRALETVLRSRKAEGA